MGRKIKYTPFDFGSASTSTQLHMQFGDDQGNVEASVTAFDRGHTPFPTFRFGCDIDLEEDKEVIASNRVDSRKDYRTQHDEDQEVEHSLFSSSKHSLQEPIDPIQSVQNREHGRFKGLDLGQDDEAANYINLNDDLGNSELLWNIPAASNAPPMLVTLPLTPPGDKPEEAFSTMSLVPLPHVSLRMIPEPRLLLGQATGASIGCPPLQIGILPALSAFSIQSPPPRPFSAPFLTPGPSPTLSQHAPCDRPLCHRKRVQNAPTPGQVYYMPDGRDIPCSIIHGQKQQDGFFKHPVLVVGIEGHVAYFYALTKAPPHAIGELKMCLRIGVTVDDEGPCTLKLAPGSLPMMSETWLNLEQRFYIEWPNLEEWAVDVRVDPDDLWKIWKRVQELEEDQNRYIYKPLPRDMSLLRPGTVVMLPNDPRSSTLGAPVLLVENMYPRFRFLRVKQLKDNLWFNPLATRKHGSCRSMCLQISKLPKMGHDGTPVMLLEPGSPDMRELSYVEVHVCARIGNLDRCKTWCWPPVRIREQSMRLLQAYMTRMALPALGTVAGSLTDSRPSSRASSVLYPPTPTDWGAAQPCASGVPHPSGGAGMPLLNTLSNGYQEAANTYAFNTPPHTPFSLHFPPLTGYTNPHASRNDNLPPSDSRHCSTILFDRSGQPLRRA